MLLTLLLCSLAAWVLLRRFERRPDRGQTCMTAPPECTATLPWRNFPTVKNPDDSVNRDAQAFHHGRGFA